jgi:hypothetical protein
MEIIIKGTIDEIAGLVTELQGQQKETIKLSRDVEELQKYILAAREEWLKKVLKDN